MRNIYITCCCLLLILSCTRSTNNQVKNDLTLKLSKSQTIEEAMIHEYNRVRDPATGEIPYERLEQAKQYYAEMSDMKMKTSTTYSHLRWEERGPNNIGGRTRAILFLPAKEVLAAGVTGGLWKTDDITLSNPIWSEVESIGKSINVSCITQHSDPDSTDLLYLGTGEPYVGSSGPSGTGIYKSIDGGLTWNVLSATVPSSTSSNLFKIANILVAANGDVYSSNQGYFCNRGGLWKSTNNGASWTKLLGTHSRWGLFCKTWDRKRIYCS